MPTFPGQDPSPLSQLLCVFTWSSVVFLITILTSIYHRWPILHTLPGSASELESKAIFLLQNSSWLSSPYRPRALHQILLDSPHEISRGSSSAPSKSPSPTMRKDKMVPRACQGLSHVWTFTHASLDFSTLFRLT